MIQISLLFMEVYQLLQLEERKQWLDKLETVYQMVIPEMSKYEYPNGPVIAFGYPLMAYLM
jgi:hypothetical protein